LHWAIQCGQQPAAPGRKPATFAVGDPLPTLPLRLTGDLFVPVEFEAAYQEACRRRRLVRNRRAGDLHRNLGAPPANNFVKEQPSTTPPVFDTVLGRPYNDTEPPPCVALGLNRLFRFR
jgi:hypothetical protein